MLSLATLWWWLQRHMTTGSPSSLKAKVKVKVKLLFPTHEHMAYISMISYVSQMTYITPIPQSVVRTTLRMTFYDDLRTPTVHTNQEWIPRVYRKLFHLTFRRVSTLPCQSVWWAHFGLEFRACCRYDKPLVTLHDFKLRWRFLRST